MLVVPSTSIRIVIVGTGGILTIVPEKTLVGVDFDRRLEVRNAQNVISRSSGMQVVLP